MKTAPCGCDAEKGPCAEAGNGPAGVAHFLRAMTGHDLEDIGRMPQPGSASGASGTAARRLLRRLVSRRHDAEEGPFRAVLVREADLHAARSLLGLDPETGT